MIDRTTKLRWRRRFRQRKRQVEDMGTEAENRLEQHFFRRLNKLTTVKRFIASWLILVLLLIGGVVVQLRSLGNYYLSSQPIPGGIYVEGIQGAFTNANPIYAAGSVDNAVSSLVFAGLLKYDQNNKLTYNLAEKWEVDDTGRVYTLTLRPRLTWHDGKPLRAEDVVFTYKTIQNPDAKSPLRINWQGINIESQGEYTVVFTLPNTLSSFPYSLTSGIIPKHLLGEVQASQLRSHNFNTANPIGSGPFKWESIEVKGLNPADREEQIGLVPFEQFHAGAPKLQRFTVRAFRDKAQMVNSFKDRELNGMAGLEAVPKELENSSGITEYNVPLTSQVMVFFKTTEAPFTDVKVRQALVQSADTLSIINGLGYPVIPAKSPFLSGHIGYDKSIVQNPLNLQNAQKLLDESGWHTGDKGIRYKDGQALSFRLFSQSNSEYEYVAEELRKQWAQLGVQVEVVLQTADELQNAVAQHTYDALLYGISLGVDPDVFAFWHSTQASSRSGSWLNFSEYQSRVADSALEAGRTRDDPAIRTVKYKPFLESWRNDAPALSLYQPRFLYIVRGEIHNFQPKHFNAPSDRYMNVEKWMIREGNAPKEQ